MTPTSLADLIAADRVGALKAAVVARFAALLPGVRVVDHPGKVDIADIVAKTVVSAPGVAIGWSRIRPLCRADGGADLEVSLVAYVVAEDKVIAERRVERERLALGIGTQLLRVIGAPDERRWGLSGLADPEGADLKPLFTARDAGQGVAYYAVTWTQQLLDVVEGPFEGLPVGVGDPDAATIRFETVEDMERAAAAWLSEEP